MNTFVGFLLDIFTFCYVWPSVATSEYHFPCLQQVTPFHSHNEGIIMQAVKQEALNTIARLPEDADMEEIMYRLYVLENIRRGQQDGAQGKIQSAEEVLRDIQTW